MLLPELDKRGCHATILKLAGPLASHTKAKGRIGGQAGVLRFNYQKRKDDYHGLRNDASAAAGSAVTAGPGANHLNTFFDQSSPDTAELRKRRLLARGPAMCVLSFWQCGAAAMVPSVLLRPEIEKAAARVDPGNAQGCAYSPCTR